MPDELKFFSYKIMPVRANSFAEFMDSESYYSKKELEDEVKEEMRSRDIAVAAADLSFTVRDGYLFAEGFGHTVKKQVGATLEESNSFHLLKRLIMLSNEILSEFQQKIFGNWCNEAEGKKYSIISNSKIILSQQGVSPQEFNYELSVGDKGYCVKAFGQKLDIEVVEETEKLIKVKISNGRTVTLKRC